MAFVLVARKVAQRLCFSRRLTPSTSIQLSNLWLIGPIEILLPAILVRETLGALNPSNIGAAHSPRGPSAFLVPPTWAGIASVPSESMATSSVGIHKGFEGTGRACLTLCTVELPQAALPRLMSRTDCRSSWNGTTGRLCHHGDGDWRARIRILGAPTSTRSIFPRRVRATRLARANEAGMTNGCT